jgi:hypothetical protein
MIDRREPWLLREKLNGFSIILSRYEKYVPIRKQKAHTEKR